MHLDDYFLEGAQMRIRIFSEAILILGVVVGIVISPATMYASVVEIHLTIAKETVQITGNPTTGMTINGGIPGPTLRFRQGDLARIHVHNKMDVDTSIHWHGVLVPPDMDGVPYITFPPIKPGTTFTYEFPIRQAGTYWYHSHTSLQEQSGLYGSIVIESHEKGFAPDRDEVIVLSDWTDEDPHSVNRTLRSGNHWYAIQKGSAQSMLGAARLGMLNDYFKRELQRMPPMDIADVAYDRFLANGRTESTIHAKPGEVVRLRVIDGSSTTFFHLTYAGGPVRILSADGQDVEPVEVSRLLIGVAETYDLLIKVPDEGAYEFRATAHDASAYASVWIGSGPRHPAPSVPRPNLYHTMGDLKLDQVLALTPAGSMGMPDHKVDAGHFDTPGMMGMDPKRPWPPYSKLRSTRPTAFPKGSPVREIRLTLDGDMERYVWFLNNRPLSESDDILIKEGELVRFIMINRTMMHHPMHLHGHFFRVVNGHGDYAPLKHTVDVAPMSTTVIEFMANEVGDWFFHCHLLYHMKSGMSRVVHYEGFFPDSQVADIRPILYRENFYAWGTAGLFSNMTLGSLELATTRYSLTGDWEVGWQKVDDTEWEGTLKAERFMNRFFTLFVGVNAESVNHGSDTTRGVIGLHYLLPFNVESMAWLDTDLGGRFRIEKTFELTPRLELFGEAQYDTHDKWEGRAGLSYTINKNLSAVGHWHSDYGWGGGLEVRF
jgi:FtsP/CotA-like multicopper oxidase with cupredoxin domain